MQGVQVGLHDLREMRLHVRRRLDRPGQQLHHLTAWRGGGECLPVDELEAAGATLGPEEVVGAQIAVYLF